MSIPKDKDDLFNYSINFSLLAKVIFIFFLIFDKFFKNRVILLRRR